MICICPADDHAIQSPRDTRRSSPRSNRASRTRSLVATAPFDEVEKTKKYTLLQLSRNTQKQLLSLPNSIRHIIFKMSTSHKTLLYFGDQTDSWVDGIDYIMKQALSNSWLRSFMNDMARKVKEETRAMEPAITESLGDFTSLFELAERYRDTADEAGLANAILIYTMRAAMLLQLVKFSLTTLSLI